MASEGRNRNSSQSCWEITGSNPIDATAIRGREPMERDLTWERWHTLSLSSLLSITVTLATQSICNPSVTLSCDAAVGKMNTLSWIQVSRRTELTKSGRTSFLKRDFLAALCDLIGQNYSCYTFRLLPSTCTFLLPDHVSPDHPISCAFHPLRVQLKHAVPLDSS